MTWTNTTIDTGLGYPSGGLTAMCKDSLGLLHIAYLDFNGSRTIKYGHWNGTAWELETISVTPAGVTLWIQLDIAVDSNNYPRILYTDQTTDVLRLVVWDGATWNDEAVISGGMASISDAPSKIVIDSADKNWIVYNKDLGYTNVAGISFGANGAYNSIELEGTPFGAGGICIAIKDDIKWIAYKNTTDLKVWYNSANTNNIIDWALDLTDSSPSPLYPISIAIKSTGEPGIAYRTVYGLINFIEKSGTWESSVEAYSLSGINSIKLNFDGSDNPRIALCPNGQPLYVERNLGVWGASEFIDSITGEGISSLFGSEYTLYYDLYSETLVFSYEGTLPPPPPVGGTSVDYSRFKQISITGDFTDGDPIEAIDCKLKTLQNIGTSVFRNCLIDTSLSIYAGSSPILHDCFSEENATVDIDFQTPGAVTYLAMYGAKGEFVLKNMNSDSTAIIAGDCIVTVHSSCTSANIKLYGDVEYVDNGTTTNLTDSRYGGDVGDDIAAIKAKTDNLPVDPASETTVGGIAINVDAVKLKTDNLPHSIKKNTALNNFKFVMLDANTGDPVSDLTVTAEVSLDSAGFVAMTNAVVERSHGVYEINIAAADVNGDTGIFKFTATGAETTMLSFITEAV